MSESPSAKADKPLFTEKEERCLKVAWHCFKGPLPDIDLEKFKVAADFNTVKTASNIWGTIKKKLATLAPPAAEGEDAAPSSTKSKTTPKKRSRKAAEGDDEEEETPTKKRKMPKKIKAGEDELVVKAEEGDAED